MAKRRHHFVPRFYLRAFGADDRRIHLFNIARNQGFENVSLRHQCYRPRFYGESDEVEDDLARVEGEASTVLREIRESCEPPARGSRKHAQLLSFVGLQLLRTPVEREKLANAFAQFKELITGRGRASPDVESVRHGRDIDAGVLRALLNTLPRYVAGLADLHLLVARATGGSQFAISDNPAVAYNSYCAHVRAFGVTGALSRGLQIFLPLSPHLILVLFDSWVYRPQAKGHHGRFSLTRDAVMRLNGLQVVSAEHNLYFADWGMLNFVTDAVRQHRQFRNDNPMKVEELTEVGNERNTLVHTFEASPQFDFRLPLSELRWLARQIPLSRRAGMYRKPAMVIPSGATRVYRGTRG